MQLLLYFLGASTPFLALVNAQGTTSSQCYTYQAETSLRGPVPTSTTTTTVPCTIIADYVTTVTVTPSPTTSTHISTVVKTTTATIPKTDVLTRTVTSTTTTTKEGQPITKTKTSTVTVKTDITITIPASTPFAPVQSSILDSSQKKRALLFPREKVVGKKEVHVAAVPLHKRATPTLYPSKVVCTATTTSSSCTTIKATSTTTVTAPGVTSTVTSTTTSTSTITSACSASTTITKTTTSTATATHQPTTTITSTTTTKIYTATKSFYAACATNNVASNVQGQPFNGYQVGVKTGTFSESYINNSTAYDCCVACLLNPKCGPWLLDLPNDNQCHMFEYNACTGPTVSENVAEIDSYTSLPSWYIIGNGYCGQWNTFRRLT